ncbi:hypothetical protein VPNG_08977 [Cytospora leucostoma]|uniref:Uncharacterized protein n=1 Tax=Cytospora leucostoma TaxID=1230097 RepID=A0A423VW30_9PEZI|nr:hypothetical protein VPNG_08977 [Cytospora leucostoma]
MPGRHFLPRFNIDCQRQAQVSIEWDLSGLFRGTRAVCSLGGGPEPITAQGNADTLLDSVFMVGPVNSHPAEPPPHARGPAAEDAGSSGGTTYWFGDLPPNLSAVRDYATKIFPAWQSTSQTRRWAATAPSYATCRGAPGSPAPSSGRAASSSSAAVVLEYI